MESQNSGLHLRRSFQLKRNFDGPAVTFKKKPNLNDIFDKKSES